MADLTQPLPDDADDSPRAQPSPLALTFALAGAPFAWIVQLLSGFVLANRPCFAAAQALAERVPATSGQHPAPLIVHLVCLALAVAATLLAARIWRASTTQAPASVIDIGGSRTHFLALCGLSGGFVFVVSILFDTPGLFVVPLCPQ